MVGNEGVYLRKDLRRGNHSSPQSGQLSRQNADWLIEDEGAAFEVTVNAGLTYEAWCKQILSEQFSSDSLLSRSYQYKLEKYLYPAIGKVPLHKLERFRLVNLIMEWQQRGVDYYTIEYLTGLLSKTLEYAVAADLLLENPCETVVRKMTRTRIEALSASEQATLEQFSERKRSYLDQAAVIALHTGLRAEEITALKWENVDLEQRLLAVEAALPANGETRGLQRVIPMSNRVVQLLLQLKESENKSRYVFSQVSQPCQARGITEYFCGSGEPESLTSIHFRRLRYTFVKHFLENTGDLAAVSALIGEPEIQSNEDSRLNGFVGQKPALQAAAQPIRA